VAGNNGSRLFVKLSASKYLQALTPQFIVDYHSSGKLRSRYFCTLIVALAACSPPKPAHDDAWFNTPDGTWTADSRVVSEMKSAVDVALGTAWDERPNTGMRPARYWFQYFGYGSETDKSIAIVGRPFPVPEWAGASFHGAVIPEDCHIFANYRPRERKFSQFAVGGFNCPPRLTLRQQKP
jgi:hypothetical protein